MWQCTQDRTESALKGQLSRQQLEQCDAERIIVRAIVEVAIHPPGLLGRNIGKRAFEMPGGGRTLPL